MRFMMMIYPGEQAEAGVMPDARTIAGMMSFNEQLAKAGVLLALDGLQSSSRGARIHKEGGRRIVNDGPFAEAKELIGGYWLLQVKSKDEAIAWATRCPIEDGQRLEIRQLFEMSDFGPDVEHRE